MAKACRFNPPHGWGWWLHPDWGVTQIKRKNYAIGNRYVERNFKRQASISRATRRVKGPWKLPPAGARQWSLWTGRRRRSVEQTKAEWARKLVERITS